MKRIFILSAMLISMAQLLFAQSDSSTLIKNLPEVKIGSLADIHFLSPQPIQYVDISTHSVTGDLPVKNILRVKIIPDSLSHLQTGRGNLGIITIVGENYIAQYKLVFTDASQSDIPSEVEVMPYQCRPLDFPGVTLTTPEMKESALAILSKRKFSDVRHAKAYGLMAQLNHVYTSGDEVFLDISYTNNTNLAYTPDELRFKVEDKKINKATNVQSIEVKPDWRLYPLAEFKRQFRNIYVFKKMTFPDNKVLNIELSEKQVSGRTVTLKISYGDLLHADTL